jgi:hypothetical protein
MALMNDIGIDKKLCVNYTLICVKIHVLMIFGPSVMYFPHLFEVPKTDQWSTWYRVHILCDNTGCEIVPTCDIVMAFNEGLYFVIKQYVFSAPTLIRRFFLLVCVIAFKSRREKMSFIVTTATRWVEWLFGETLILEMRTEYGREDMEFTKLKSIVVRNRDEGEANIFVVQSKHKEEYIWWESTRFRGEQEIQQDLNAAKLWKELGDRNRLTDNPKYTPI